MRILPQNIFLEALLLELQRISPAAFFAIPVRLAGNLSHLPQEQFQRTIHLNCRGRVSLSKRREH